MATEPSEPRDQSQAREYSIPAIPTRYRGRLYRSRLEARWAAFFDLMDWEFEYEPFDLGSWSPDILFPNRGAPESFLGILAEIKPITAFDKEVGERIVGALKASQFHNRAAVSLFGVAPWIEAGHCCVSWTCHARHGWAPTCVVWKAKPDRPAFWPIVQRLGEEYPKGDVIKAYPDYTMFAWSRASNAVQWRGGEAQS